MLDIAIVRLLLQLQRVFCQKKRGAWLGVLAPYRMRIHEGSVCRGLDFKNEIRLAGRRVACLYIGRQFLKRAAAPQNRGGFSN